MTAAATYRSCPSCTSDQIADLASYARDQWRIGMCKVCAFVHLRNPVEYEALEEEYSWDVTYDAAGSAATKKRSLLSQLAFEGRKLGYRLRGRSASVYLRHLRAGRIIDIGCADVVRFNKPVVPFGIELSKSLASKGDAKMRAMGGFCIQGAGAEAIWDFEESAYDGVLMHSYLEHEVDFDRVLQGAFRALKPGGKVFIRVPNFASLNRRLAGAKWPGFRYPDHVNYFTPATLRTVCEAAGFQFQMLNRHKIWLDDNIQALAIKPA